MLSIKTWGNIVWLFLHTFAEKVNEETFSNKKHNIINLLRVICRNLPCPECAEHATKYIGAIELEKYINTKKDLKDFIFVFHNKINQKLNKPNFNKDKLDSEYSNVDINKAYQDLLKVYTSKIPSAKLMINNLSRTSSPNLIKNYMKLIFS